LYLLNRENENAPRNLVEMAFLMKELSLQVNKFQRKVVAPKSDVFSFPINGAFVSLTMHKDCI